MNRTQFVSKVYDKLHKSGFRKEFTVPAHSLKISDSDGNVKEFKYKPMNKSALYSIADVNAILDACIETVIDAMRDGEPISIPGFCKTSVKRRAARRSMDIRDKTLWHDVPSFTYPSASFGRNVQAAARTYGLLQEQKEKAIVAPFEEDED